MSTNVLITGGSGLLATNLALAMRDYYSVTLGLHSRDISLDGVEVITVDLDSIENLKSVVDLVKPNVIIHTAGLTSVEKCDADQKLAYHINVELAVNVARVCAEKEIGLVHISTDHLFTGEFSLVDETYSVQPINTYARTKAEAESRVLEVNPKAIVLRTNFYGWGTSYRSSFSDIIIQTLRAGKKITLFNDVFYTPILIEVMAQTIHELINAKAHGIFHVVGDQRISKYEFGLKLAKEFNLDINLIMPGNIADNPSLVQRPHDMSLSNKKVCKLLHRKLGSVSEHIATLHQQEKNGLAQELIKL